MDWTNSRLVNDVKFALSCLTRPKAVKGYYCAWIGYQNLGDTAMFDASYAMFGPRAAFHYNRKGKLAKILGRIPLFRTDFVLMGGGTHIFENDDELEKMTLPDASKRIIFGTGVSDPTFLKEVLGRTVSMERWLEELEKLDYIAVRGPWSQKLLKERGLKKEVKVLGDTALYYAREIRAPKPMKKKLGVNFGFVHNTMWGKDEEKLYAHFVEFLKRMIGDGWNIEVVPVSEEDVAHIHKAVKEADPSGKIPVFKDFRSVAKTIDKLETFDVFIGLRLHSVIFSYCANTPAVMIEYRPKARDFMQSIGMGDFNIRTDEFTAEKGKKLVETLYADLENYRRKTNRLCLDYKSFQAREAETVLGILR